MSTIRYATTYPRIESAFPKDAEGAWIVLGRVVPDLSDLPPAEAEDWRRAIARYSSVCGCNMGAAFAITAVAPWIGAIVLYGSIGGSWLADVGIGVALFLLAGGTGKALGMARARAKLDDFLVLLARRILEARSDRAARDGA